LDEFFTELLREADDNLYRRGTGGLPEALGGRVLDPYEPAVDCSGWLLLREFRGVSFGML